MKLSDWVGIGCRPPRRACASDGPVALDKIWLRRVLRSSGPHSQTVTPCKQGPLAILVRAKMEATGAIFPRRDASLVWDRPSFWRC